MLSIEEIQRQLGERYLDPIVEATGIHRSTLSRIKRLGGEANPTFAVMKRLSDYLTGQPQ